MEMFDRFDNPTYGRIPRSQRYPAAIHVSWFGFLFWHGFRILVFLVLCATALYVLNTAIAMFLAWVHSVWINICNAATTFWDTYGVFIFYGGFVIFMLFLHTTSSND